MCGRFALNTDIEQLQKEFKVTELPEVSSRFNIAPSQDILILIQTPEGEVKGNLFTWGLIPFFAKDRTINPPLINARAESIDTKPAFRHSLKNKRGLIVMSGFFEWHTEDGKKQPYYITSKNNNLLAIAALWDIWQSSEGEIIHSCCLITTASNSLLQSVHHRMPAILNVSEQKLWLDTSSYDKTLLATLHPYAEDDLTLYPVTKKVSYWRYTEKDAIQRLN
jgi:putative SOS response-associated peptidase YedK